MRNLLLRGEMVSDLKINVVKYYTQSLLLYEIKAEILKIRSINWLKKMEIWIL